MPISERFVNLARFTNSLAPSFVQHVLDDFKLPDMQQHLPKLKVHLYTWVDFVTIRTVEVKQVYRRKFSCFAHPRA